MGNFIINELEHDSYALECCVGDVNNALVDYVLDVLKASGFKARDVNRGDSYFIFRGHPGSIASFKLPRVWPGWLFGLWVNGEHLLDDSDGKCRVLSLFCQHESQVDKFKPSASDLLLEFDKSDVLWMLDVEAPPSTTVVYRKTADFARQIWLHPFMSYHGIMDEWWPTGERLVPSAIRGLVEGAARPWRKKLSAWMLERYGRDKCEVANSLDFVKECSFTDLGSGWMPRYEIRCELDGCPTSEQEERILKLFPKSYYRGRSLRSETMDVSIVFQDSGKWFEVSAE